MDVLLNLLQNEAVQGALAVIVAWALLKYVFPKVLQSPETKARLRLILAKLDDNFTWIEQHAEELGISRYQKLAKLMDMISDELAKQLETNGTLTPSEQALVAKMAAEKAKNS